MKADWQVPGFWDREDRTYINQFGIRDARWQDKSQWAWWIEWFDGVIGWLIIAALLVAIIVVAPGGLR